MKVLVTGNRGFIASKLVKRLLENTDYQVCGINRSSGMSIESAKSSTDSFVEVYSELSNAGYAESLFKNFQPDIIYHFAAQQGRTPEAFNANVAMTANLLQYCPQGCKFVYASSSTVYGDLGVELAESSKTLMTTWPDYQWTSKCRETDRTIPTSLYGASKLAGEALVQAYASSGKIHPLILRYVATVGKGATHGAVPDLIKKLRQDGPLELFGEAPGSIKPYMHVDDVVSATLYLEKNGYTGTYNIAPDDEISIGDIAKLLDGFVNGISLCPKEFKWLGPESVPPGDNPLVTLSNEKLLNTGWEPKYHCSTKAIVKTADEIL